MSKRWSIYGPELHRRKWRVRIRAPDGQWRSRSFAREEEAAEYRRTIEQELEKNDAQRKAARLYAEADQALTQAEAVEGRSYTVSEAMAEYDRYLRTQKENRASSVTTALYRLRALLRELLSTQVAKVTVSTAQRAYKARTQAVSAATHRGELREARALWRWLEKRGWVVANPWAEVEPVGRVNKGKEQLRGHEARRLADVVLQQARGQDLGTDNWSTARQESALAVLCALYLGLRASEVVGLRARDVADGEIFIAKGKTERSTRRVRVPEPLWSLLSGLARARVLAGGGSARVFPHRREWLLENTKRLCRTAGVPEVCAHSLRGMHATLATEAGSTGHAVAAQLGHSTPAITHAHYTRPEAATAARQRSVLQVLHREQNSGAPGSRNGGES